MNGSVPGIHSSTGAGLQNLWALVYLGWKSPHDVQLKVERVCGDTTLSNDMHLLCWWDGSRGKEQERRRSCQLLKIEKEGGRGG